MSRVLPPEWAPQDGVLLVWPHADSDWNHDLPRAEQAFATLAVAIARFTRLILACSSETTRGRALARLEERGVDPDRVATVTVRSDDTWARDIAPITVLDDDRPVGLDGNFNGWGEKYPHSRDAAFARELLRSHPFTRFAHEQTELVLEGGSIEVDDRGVALLNRRTVLEPARNPEHDRASAESVLRRRYGIERVLWLDVPPVPGDDTDGHVDTLVRFTETGTPACTAPHSEDDPAAPMLAALHDQLAALHAAGEIGKPIHLPGPVPFRRDSGEPCPATYANFLVIDGAVLVPAYADANDAVAVERLQPCFPGRTIVPVPARTFVEQSGSVHCLTMQWPRGSLAPATAA